VLLDAGANQRLRITYGGFLLLGGRLADLLGPRRMLVAGTAVFGLASLVGGLAQDSDAGRRKARSGTRRRVDVAGRAVDPDHDLQSRHRPGEGGRRLGCHGRHRVDRRGLPRRRDLRGTGLAVGPVREPARLRAGAAERVQAS
jgi:hypothetical protein